LDNFITKLLKNGCSSASIGLIMVSGGLCVGYERCDRLKVSVPVNGGHFER